MPELISGEWEWGDGRSYSSLLSPCQSDQTSLPGDTESWGRNALPAGQDAMTAGLLSPPGKSVSGPALEAKYNKINPALKLAPNPAACPLPALSRCWGQPLLGLGALLRLAPACPSPLPFSSPVTFAPLSM